MEAAVSSAVCLAERLGEGVVVVMTHSIVDEMSIDPVGKTFLLLLPDGAP